MGIKRYRKKPVVIRAIQFNGHNWAECEDFIAGEPLMHPQWMMEYDHLDIRTLEGVMRADVGDYIIKGVMGECYPCKPEIFEKTYEEVKQGRND